MMTKFIICMYDDQIYDGYDNQIYNKGDNQNL